MRYWRQIGTVAVLGCCALFGMLCMLSFESRIVLDEPGSAQSAPGTPDPKLKQVPTLPSKEPSIVGNTSNAEPRQTAAPKRPPTVSKPPKISDDSPIEPDVTKSRRFTWPKDWPESLQPAGFDSRAKAAFAQCATPAVFEGVRCEQAPCVLLMSVARDAETRLPGDWASYDEFLGSCDSWSTAYGAKVNRTRQLSDDPASQVHGLSRSVWCEDGREFWVLMIVPERSFKYLNVDEAFEFNQARDRLQARLDVYVDAWLCP